MARSFDIPAVHGVAATFRLSGTSKRVKVVGEVRARVEQICVVTLEPFASDVVETIEVDFAAERPRRALADDSVADWDEAGKANRSRGSRRGHDPEGRSAEIRLTDADPPDEIIDGTIDLGQLAVEFLALGLDPYPRKPGSFFASEAGGVEVGDDAPSEDGGISAAVDKPSPFAALSRLKAKSEGRN